MEKKEYVIRVAYDVKSDEEVGKPTSGIQDAQANNKKTKEKEKENPAKAIAAYMGKQAANYAVSNYGNLTGDYIAQANIQGTIEVAGLMALAVTGPVGAVAAGAGLALRAASKTIDISKQNQQTAYLRERTGMATYSGGRSWQKHTFIKVVLM